MKKAEDLISDAELSFMIINSDAVNSSLILYHRGM